MLQSWKDIRVSPDFSPRLLIASIGGGPEGEYSLFELVIGQDEVEGGLWDLTSALEGQMGAVTA
jgi:hypothetical protein